jgi:hypothetical protein
MNIGLIVPAEIKERKFTGIAGAIKKISTLFNKNIPIEFNKISVTKGINLAICCLKIRDFGLLKHGSVRRRLRLRLKKLLESERVWPVMEHSKLRGLTGLSEYCCDDTSREIAMARLPEVLNLVKGLGDLSMREITVTGHSVYLEYAISRLITRVKVMNLLIPEGNQEPEEAEAAFIETGIPVHVTADYEVLRRTALWIRFPDDHQSFDELPQIYNGIIVDFGSMKIIDTKNKKIFSIFLEFSDTIKSKIGHDILRGWDKGVLESIMVASCAEMWELGLPEAASRLGMQLCYKS